MPSRPRSPIYDVVEHKFQRDWLRDQKRIDALRVLQQSGEQKTRKTVQEGIKYIHYLGKPLNNTTFFKPWIFLRLFFKASVFLR